MNEPYNVDSDGSFQHNSSGISSKCDLLNALSVCHEPFFFESDALALRSNLDYSCLLKTLVLLEAQRVQACADIETLIDMKQDALNNPAKFLNQNNNVPLPQKVYILPAINWDKYYECVDMSDFEAIKCQNNQRVHSLRQSVKLIQQLETSTVPGQDESSRAVRSSERTSKQQTTSKQENKEVKNYNKSWSVAEQRQLEELLLEFPPEDNEAQRFRKIANKLELNLNPFKILQTKGTRTPLQVQSHCQKYFIKLAKAGLPIPGRMPNLKTYVTKKGNRGNRRSGMMRGACQAAGLGSGRSRLAGGGMTSESSRKMVGRGVSLNEISSMWTSFNPPITMNDDYDMADGEEFEERYTSSSRSLFKQTEGDEENLSTEEESAEFDNYDFEDVEEESGVSQDFISYHDDNNSQFSQNSLFSCKSSSNKIIKK